MVPEGVESSRVEEKNFDSIGLEQCWQRVDIRSFLSFAKAYRGGNDENYEQIDVPVVAVVVGSAVNLTQVD